MKVWHGLLIGMNHLCADGALQHIDVGVARVVTVMSHPVVGREGEAEEREARHAHAFGWYKQPNSGHTPGD